MEGNKAVVAKKYGIECREKSWVLACLKGFLHYQGSQESNKTRDPPLEYSLISV